MGKLKALIHDIRHNMRYGRGNFRCRQCGAVAFDSWCSNEHFETYKREHNGVF